MHFGSGPAKALYLTLMLVLTAGVLSSLSPPSLAQNAQNQAVEQHDAAQVEAQLSELRERIENINQRLINQRGQQQEQQAALSESERSLGQLTRQLRDTSEELAEVRQQVQTLSEQTGALETQISQQRERLGQQLRVAYQIGVQSRLRAMLSGEDPNQIARKLALHGYLGRARLEAVQTLDVQIERLDQLLEEQRRNRAQLNQLQLQQQDQLTRQEISQAQREQALIELNQSIQTDEQALSNLRLDAERLQSLLEDLANVLADIPAQIESVPFADLKGQLTMPVSGLLRARYGDIRSGDVRWSGWLIQADEGVEVNAIAYGRIAYSDWLRGYGLILIIDHGHGFMSLYGHNQALLADVGDWVGPGQAIALAGNSGGEDEAGLYFELRKDGETINPARWMQQ